jgi:hypothetical protein
MLATVRSYATAVVFEQEFPSGLSGAATGDTQKVISAFPSFRVDGNAEPARGCLPFQGACRPRAGTRSVSAQANVAVTAGFMTGSFSVPMPWGWNNASLPGGATDGGG